MAARFLPHRVPAYADAFLSSHLPGPTVPLHHRAGPQSLHRNCGKIVFDYVQKDTCDAIYRTSSRSIPFNQTFLKFFEFFSSFQCLICYCDFSDTPLRRGWLFCASGWQHGRDDVRRGVPRTVQMSRWPGATLSSPRNWSAFQTKDLHHNFGLFVNNWSCLASGQYVILF